MRSTIRLLAKVKPGQFLEANTPTGLTGLLTHPSPRPSLIVLYNQTLSKLKEIPESSVYRRSTEALTKHRLKIVTETKPEGYDAWHEKVKKIAEQDLASYEHLKQPDGIYSPRYFLGQQKIEWDGETKTKYAEGGAQTTEDVKRKAQKLEDIATTDFAKLSLEVEPPLTVEQINDIESKIGAGLIEEVIQVAEGELEVVQEMINSKVWEPLEDKAPEGQWVYFERGQN